MTNTLPLTEQRNECSLGIDSASSEEILRIINAGDATVSQAVEQEIPHITRALDAIVKQWHQGGRLFYVGAGTSGRLGVLDASECPPTFSTPPERVQAIIAGGQEALQNAVEGAEDRPEDGKSALQQRGFDATDSLVGIAASGSTPFVLGAVDHANQLGAVTVGLSCCPGSALELAAQFPITPLAGPEIITGSTRMKAGTAQKLVLNMLSTGLMIQTGYVYNNLMVNLHVKNNKLAERAVRIICTVTGCSPNAAHDSLQASGEQVRVSIVMLLCGLGREQAEQRLTRYNNNLRKALEESHE